MTDPTPRPQEPQEAPSAWLPRQLRGIAAELLAGTDFGDVQQAAALIESQAAELLALRQRLDERDLMTMERECRCVQCIFDILIGFRSPCVTCWQETATVAVTANLGRAEQAEAKLAQALTAAQGETRRAFEALEQVEAELMMAKRFLHEVGTDPEAWLDGALSKLRAYLTSRASEPKEPTP